LQGNAARLHIGWGIGRKRENAGAPGFIGQKTEKCRVWTVFQNEADQFKRENARTARVLKSRTAQAGQGFEQVAAIAQNHLQKTIECMAFILLKSAPGEVF